MARIQRQFQLTLIFIPIFLLILILFQFTEVQAKVIGPESCVGHRGAMDMAPQNTMASFEEALKSGYKRMECDIWYTRSGDILVCHLPNIKDYTGVDKYIWDVTPKNRWLYPITRGKNVKNHKAQYIPTIDEVLYFAKIHHIKIYLHLKQAKYMGGTTFTKKALRKLNGKFKYYNLSRKPVVFSSNKAIVRRMKKYKFSKGFLISSAKRKKIKAASNFAARNKCDYLLAPYRKKVKPKKKTIKYVHSKGLKIAYYRVWSEKRAKRVFRKGGDFCITNRILFNR